MTQPVIIGIAGGTGSGKTTIANEIQRMVEENITLIPQDAYYKSFAHLTVREREVVNFDHPNSFDLELMTRHLRLLKKNKPIDRPVYDFTTHLRKKETVTLVPSKIIIIEGILIFADEKLRDEMDIKIFVDTPADIRILRRIERDISERGRTLRSVVEQYRISVRPSHLEFVEPSKVFADVIIPEGGHNRIGINMLVAQVRHIINK
ncbi:MAG: uridine kinase [Candidatus Cloacimonetes bacterium]|nr:uridine kinase [Candidatus Cloacimonadota bacterium]